jgi:protein phosphatase 2C family protein 2/3
MGKPSNRQAEVWPECSFFGIYDGHGGSGCADFLRDNLHHFIVKEPSFPSKPEEAIKRAFKAAECNFLELSQTSEPCDPSGSCAVVVLIVGNKSFIANVGDSRAIASM